MGVKITRIRISNLLGVEHLDQVLNGSGVWEGGNGRGKSSVIKAIKMALGELGVGPECIRVGADRAEILLDLEAYGATEHGAQSLTVRQSITEAGASLTVKNADGDKWSRPRNRLSALVGGSIDAVAFWLGSKADRRRQLLAAFPSRLTGEDVATWTEGDQVAELDLDRPGLAVLEELAAHYKKERTTANAAARDAEGKHAEAAAFAKMIDLPAVPGLVVPLEGGEDAAVSAAEAELEKLRQREAGAKEVEQRTASTRERIAKLRAEAARLGQLAETSGPSIESVEATLRQTSDLAQEHGRLVEVIERAQKALAVVEGQMRKVTEEQLQLDKLRRTAERFGEDAKRTAAQADELEATLAELAVDAPSVEDFAAAVRAVSMARAQADLIKQQRAAHDAVVDAAHLGDVATNAKAHAEKVGRIYEALTTTAVAELAKRADLIPGLALVNGEIVLDGRNIEHLSGAEQMQFAVELARRVSPGKLLTVDELEKLDPERLDEFVHCATADGWQLIGAMVAAGELRFVALEPTRTTIVMPEEQGQPQS
jgi:hypothetical protein